MTTGKGAGLCHYGTAPAGYGNPDELNPHFKLWVRADGTKGNARYIDPSTGNYQVNDDGFFVGMGEVQQQVYLALITVKGSAADPTLGQTFTTLEIISGNMQNKVTAMVQNALSSLVNLNLIKVNQIIVQQDQNQPTKLGISVVWTDLSTNNQLTTSV